MPTRAVSCDISSFYKLMVKTGTPDSKSCNGNPADDKFQARPIIKWAGQT